MPGIDIQNHFAYYLLIEPGYTVLRKWKTSGGPLFDRRILPDNACLPNFDAQAVTSIPQRFSRAWKLGRNPAEQVARWLARLHGLPYLELLEIRDEIRGPHRRQAEKGLQERVQARIGIHSIRKNLKELGSVILVDDFMTSGRTLKSGARALREAGVISVSAFALGVRPRLFHSGDDLGHGVGRPIAVSQEKQIRNA